MPYSISPMRTILFYLLLIFNVPVMAHAWSGTFMSVSDGDTVIVAPSGDVSTPVCVRLYGVDAPELGQAYGKKSRTWIQKRLPKGASVEVIPYSQDRYGRVIGLIQRDGHTLNGDLVGAGLAWVYWPYCKERFCRSWGTAEKKARADQRGLWKDSKPVRPDTWRKKHRKKK